MTIELSQTSLFTVWKPACFSSYTGLISLEDSKLTVWRGGGGRGRIRKSPVCHMTHLLIPDSVHGTNTHCTSVSPVTKPDRNAGLNYMQWWRLHEDVRGKGNELADWSFWELNRKPAAVSCLEFHDNVGGMYRNQAQCRKSLWFWKDIDVIPDNIGYLESQEHCNKSLWFWKGTRRVSWVGRAAA